MHDDNLSLFVFLSRTLCYDWPEGFSPFKWYWRNPNSSCPKIDSNGFPDIQAWPVAGSTVAAVKTARRTSSEAVRRASTRDTVVSLQSMTDLFRRNYCLLKRLVFTTRDIVMWVFSSDWNPIFAGYEFGSSEYGRGGYGRQQQQQQRLGHNGGGGGRMAATTAARRQHYSSVGSGYGEWFCDLLKYRREDSLRDAMLAWAVNTVNFFFWKHGMRKSSKMGVSKEVMEQMKPKRRVWYVSHEIVNAATLKWIFESRDPSSIDAEHELVYYEASETKSSKVKITTAVDWLRWNRRMNLPLLTILVSLYPLWNRRMACHF